jgi:4-hydroxy-3-methylbut-2-en-1-yl diphosphate reductase
MKLALANPRGFCAGVKRAIAIVEQGLDCREGPVFARHAIVHNHAVIGRLSRRGTVFVESISEILRGSTAVLSAHGSPPEGQEIRRAQR